ncbi:MAG: hypothetical protein ABMB14_10785 [Myxococcota bacterium]
MSIRGWRVVPLVVAFAVAGGCGGDGGTGDDDDAAGDDDDAPIEINCDPPLYNLDTMSCEQLGTAFGNTMSALADCNTDQDCRVVHPQCEHWNDVNCFYPANFCIDRTANAQLINTFNSEAGACGDDSDVCDCTATPVAGCVDHRCVVADVTTSL